jgi:hypothetical protein
LKAWLKSAPGTDDIEVRAPEPTPDPDRLRQPYCLVLRSVYENDAAGRRAAESFVATSFAAVTERFGHVVDIRIADFRRLFPCDDDRACEAVAALGPGLSGPQAVWDSRGGVFATVAYFQAVETAIVGEQMRDDLDDWKAWLLELAGGEVRTATAAQMHLDAGASGRMASACFGQQKPRDGFRVLHPGDAARAPLAGLIDAYPWQAGRSELFDPVRDFDGASVTRHPGGLVEVEVGTIQEWVGECFELIERYEDGAPKGFRPREVTPLLRQARQILAPAIQVWKPPVDPDGHAKG